MNEGHAALDAGERAGPAALSAWEKAEGVLGVTSKVIMMKVRGVEDPVQVGEPEILVETPPRDDESEEAKKTWAMKWALRRKQAKDARNYKEADRIRTFLRAAGWEVRDARDGSIEVVRIKRAS
jgi:cysteinyl-tRNA synthetase